MFILTSVVDQFTRTLNNKLENFLTFIKLIHFSSDICNLKCLIYRDMKNISEKMWLFLVAVL